MCWLKQLLGEQKTVGKNTICMCLSMMTSLQKHCMGKQATRTSCTPTSDGANDVNCLLHTVAPMDVKMHKSMHGFKRKLHSGAGL